MGAAVAGATFSVGTYGAPFAKESSVSDCRPMMGWLTAMIDARPGTKRSVATKKFINEKVPKKKQKQNITKETKPIKQN